MQDNLIISKLINLLDKNRVLIDNKSKLFYGKDLTQSYKPKPFAIVFPNKQEEVIELVKLANEIKIPLVPSGGRTGYSGGAVAKDGEIVVAFDKMNQIIHFDASDRQVTCEPGVTTKTIQDFAFKKNLFYPINYAVTDKCQIGGNIATNAGGIQVIRYGSTRKWVAGINVVTGNGDLLKLNHGLIKNSSGYDLRHLFIGSEGTLGLITEATLQLTMPPKKTRSIFFSVPNKDDFIEILNSFRKVVQLTAFEFFDQIAMKNVCSAINLTPPLQAKSPYYVLLAYEASEEHDDLSIRIAKKCLSKKYVSDVLISEDSKEAEKFWRFRNEISMALLKYSPYKYDIAVLPSKIANFMHEVDKVFKTIYSNLEIVWWGHVGDGNLHLNILKPKHISDNEFFKYCSNVSNQLYSLVQKYKGTISAEHGIGLLKKQFLTYSKSENEISYMHSIKKIFDPNNIMNPRKLI